ncbi:transposase [Paracoccaceae bacterium]|nr:transposase [Paracoccaceae bacterium]
MKVSAATGARWQRKWHETGAIALDVQGLPLDNGKLSVDREPLLELVAQDSDITLPELAEALTPAIGFVAHAASVGRFLRKLEYTYKKVTSRNRTAAHIAKISTARMVAIPNP